MFCTLSTLAVCCRTNGRVCATNLARLAPPSDKYILRATRPSEISGPTNAHRNDHRYISAHSTAESQRGCEMDVIACLPQAINEPVPVVRRSTTNPSTPQDKAPMPPESWSDHWVIVSGRSPGPAHEVTQPHCCLHADQYRRIVASPSPHGAMPSVSIAYIT